MVFHAPSHQELVMQPPDSVTIEQFVLEEGNGRQTYKKSRDPFTCGLSGKSYSAAHVRERVDYLARALVEELGWEPKTGSEYDKVACIYALNTIDTCPTYWAIHRLGGIATPANAGYTGDELVYQLKASKATCLFTTVLNLDNAVQAASQVGIPKERIYILDLPKQATGDKVPPRELKRVSDLIDRGAQLPPIDAFKLNKGESTTRTAFLCFSSGTSGLPKAVMISHSNVIANIICFYSADKLYRAHRSPNGKADDVTDKVLLFLPMSHIYALVLIAHHSVWAGDQCVVLPNFKMDWMLQSVQDYELNFLYLVPPVIIGMIRNKDLLAKYDLSSAEMVMTGAAPLGPETADEFQKQFPNVLLRQGYGMTETSTLVLLGPYDDVDGGSAGTIIPGISAKVVDPTTLKEVTGHGQRGELWVRSPSNTLGYLHNDKATKETFLHEDDGYWVRTGDEVLVKKSAKGYEHFYVVDRIKELIKVKGHQVAPAELEALLLSHHLVGDCAVISIPDDRTGERPKAYVVKSKAVGLEDNDRMVARDICKYVEKHKSDYKWLKEVEFIDAIPKSPSGKILRRLLRDQDRERRRKAGAKL